MSKSNSITKSLKRNKETLTVSLEDNKAHNIVSHAESFNGTKYKFGGTTKKGMIVLV